MPHFTELFKQAEEQINRVIKIGYPKRDLRLRMSGNTWLEIANSGANLYNTDTRHGFELFGCPVDIDPYMADGLVVCAPYNYEAIPHSPNLDPRKQSLPPHPTMRI